MILSRRRPTSSARVALSIADVDERLVHHGLRFPAARGARAFSSIMRASRSWSRLPQLTPMRTGLSYWQATSIICANLSSCLLPAPAPDPTLPGLMRYFDSASAQSGNSRQQLVAVVMEVADERHVDAHAIELLADRRHLARRFRRIDRDPHQFRTGLRQFLDLDGRADRVGGIGVGHRLHDDGRVAADPHHATAVADQHRAGRMAGRGAVRRDAGGRSIEED